jgi:hypothetical protein
LYLVDLIDSLEFLRVFDAAATIGHEKNNIGHRQDDRRGLCLASESGGCYLAEGRVDTLKRCPGFSSYRRGERAEEPKEKVRGSVLYWSEWLPAFQFIDVSWPVQSRISIACAPELPGTISGGEVF